MTYHFGSHPISTLVDLIMYRAVTEPEKKIYTFLENGEDAELILSYHDLDQRSKAIGARLQSRYHPGDRVVLLFPPSFEFITSFFGCLYAGMMAVPTYPPNLTKIQRSLPRFLAIITDAKPAAILTTKSIIDLSRPVLKDFPELERLPWIDSESIPNETSESWKMPTIAEDDLAFLQYTSGSTATPKGVMVSHRNLLYNSAMIRQSFEINPDDQLMSWLPFYHDMGLIGGVIQPLFADAPIVLMSPLHFLQRPHRWLQAISRYKVTTSGSPNFGYEVCASKITPERKDGLDLSSWRLAFNGAEPVRPETLRRFSETFADCGFRPETFYPCYGLAEATLFVTGGLVKEAPKIIKINSHELLRDFVGSEEGEKIQEFVSCGKSWLEQEIAIVDPESLERCDPEQVGEIWISGPHVTQGYWQNPEATRASFQAKIANSDEGFYMRTGDLGFIKNGELFIAGRIKDLIIIDGLNHYPQDIEISVENCHPGLKPGGCAAFSVMEGEREQLIIVAEIRREYRDFIPEVRKAIRQAISEDHNLRAHEIVFIRTRTIPKTSSGKIQRHLCKAEYLSKQLEVVSGT
jgi:acyl-CoA synthetase (AMP-forming)/AMP-acid ligase II